MASQALKRRALFLDRDGTINREVDYLARVEDLELIPGAAQAIAEAQAAGWLIIVITNQSGIARGLLTESDLQGLHIAMDGLLAMAGASVDAYKFCPHHPEIGSDLYRKDCDCRKPKPGMYLDAIRELDIDPDASWCIGDSLRDLTAAKAAGVANCTLVETGKGAKQRANLASDDFLAKDLPEAIQGILSRA